MHKHTCRAFLSAFQNAVDAFIEAENKFDEEKMLYFRTLNLSDLNGWADLYVLEGIDTCTC